jgi:hypothetical protein
MNAPAKLTTNWFPEEERAFATMVGTNCIIGGIVVGFAFPAVFVDHFDDSVDYTPDQL